MPRYRPISLAEQLAEQSELRRKAEAGSENLKLALEFISECGLIDDFACWIAAKHNVEISAEQIAEVRAKMTATAAPVFHDGDPAP